MSTRFLIFHSARTLTSLQAQESPPYIPPTNSPKIPTLFSITHRKLTLLPPPPTRSIHYPPTHTQPREGHPPAPDLTVEPSTR